MTRPSSATGLPPSSHIAPSGWPLPRGRRIGVGDEAEPGRARGGDLGASLGVGPGAIDIVDEEFVPRAKADVIGVGEVDPGAVEADPRRRIVHHRRALLRAGGEIMVEAQRVADLVRRELADPRERGGDRVVGIAGAGEPRPDQRLEDQDVLADSKRAQDHRALDRLAGAGVGDGLAVGPAAGRSVDPVDDIVANVERVGTGGQLLDPIGAGQARRLEAFAPPVRALAKRAADRLGRGRVDVEDDRIDDDARAAELRLCFVEPEAGDEVADHRLAERRRSVDLLDPERVAVRVGARLKARLRQGDQRMADLQAKRLVGNDVLDLGRRLRGAEGQGPAQLDVARKGLGPRGLGEAEIAHQAVVAGVSRLERQSEAEVVAGDEGRQVNGEATAWEARNDVASPDGRGSEVAREAGAGGQIPARGDKLGVFDLGDDLFPDPPEGNDSRARGLPEIHRQRSRAEPRFELRDIEVAAGDPVLARRRESCDDPSGRSVGRDRDQRSLGRGCRHRKRRRPRQRN